MRHSRHSFLLALVAAVAVSLLSSSQAFAQTPKKAVSYDDVKDIVQSGLNETIALKLIDGSPTLFTLSAKQEQELRSLGASDKLIGALKKNKGGTPVRELNDLAIILDCSGSMAEQTSDGQVKMDVAKQVVTDLIERIPASLHVTFIVYGHDKVNACRRVKVARPLSPLGDDGKSELKSFIAQLQPVSKTPIALSLDTARQELAKRDAKCGLILISDGKETCGGDPQGEAKKLVEQLNCTFGVNVVAFDVDEEGTQQLQEVAEKGEGRFYEASNTAELEKAVGGLVKEVEERAVEPTVIQEKSLVSAIMIKPWNIKGFPKLKEVFVYKKGANEDPIWSGELLNLEQKITDFTKATLLTAGTYDLWYRAEGTQLVVKLGEFKLPERTKITLNGNKLVAAISVPEPELEGLGKLEAVSVVHAGKTFASTEIFQPQQYVKKYGAPMLVTPNVGHDVYLTVKGGEPVRIQKNVTAKGGELRVIGE
jgi:hypothetical protein